MANGKGTFRLALKRSFAAALRVPALALATAFALAAQEPFDKLPITRIDIRLAESGGNAVVEEQYRSTARAALGPNYALPRVRDAIAALYATGRIDTISASAQADGAGVAVIFDIKRKTQVGRVTVSVGETNGDTVTEEDILYRLNLLAPGATFTEQTLGQNADLILDHLRERGFYQSQVTYERRPMASQNEVGITFVVKPGTQATVENFRIHIDGYTEPLPVDSLRIAAGKRYSRERLRQDIERIRRALAEDDHLAPDLDGERVTYDPDRNTIAVELTGKAGPKVSVTVDTEDEKVGEGTQRTLFPVRREGTLDFSAIVEGARRLENYYQEKGYFFADVTPVCSSTPQIADNENVPIANDTEFLCQYLSTAELAGCEVEVKYRVDLNRRLKLNRLRIRGTDKVTIEDVRTVLASQEANILGIIPVLGYGRGYTSQTMLDSDAETIRSIMAELGYRDATVRVAQGVDPAGEELIITFVVEEGVPSVVTGVTITGNSAIGEDTLRSVLPPLAGRNYSRARERSAVRRLREHYTTLGYFDARITSKVSGLTGAPGDSRREVELEFKVENEGRRVVINRLLINGTERTRESALRRALALERGELLRDVDIYSSEQSLYTTDAFSRVEIKPVPAGDGPDGTRLSDVIVNVEEQPPRLLSYGGGYSTDVGLSGFFDLRHVNLFGRLWQGGARVKMSQRQQLVQFDFINPRFLRDRDKRWSALTFTAQYQRDTTVTRFFRSAFDKGTFGIVQRVDADGNPIDVFGNNTGVPTINRLGVSAETSRTISRAKRTLVFLRYRFEDVRLFNIDSLLIKDLLEPDRRTRISGFGVTFARDTRVSCTVRESLLDLIARGEPADPCRYNAADPTGGYYLTADYNVSVPALGANVGFQKFQASFNYYYTFRRLKNTTIAGRGIIGAASVFSGGDRYTNSNFPWLNGLLPISERFFGGGANSLRGFDFEEAGPRVVIVPQGTFLNSDREPVFLDPFTVPFGGNALAVANIEARIPVSRSLRVVPFYDGGNVFRRPSEIFRRPAVAPNDIASHNQRAVWTHTIGLGLRLRTPFGGEIGVDYGHLLDPPTFLIPQFSGPPAVYRLRPGHVHFRFSQAF